MISVRALLDAQGLCRSIPGTRQSLLQDVTLTVSGGDRVAIVGPTGSGKTLLLRSLALLDPIDAGQILWLGRPINAHVVPTFRRDVIYVHQRPALVEGTVEENLRLPFTFSVHAGKKFDYAGVVSALESVGRPVEFLARRSSDLSGGEAQIVALLRGLQLNPTVLLLDEPTASVDAGTANTIEHLVSHWHGQAGSGRAALWVTHDRNQSRRVANRILEMNSGRITDGV